MERLIALAESQNVALARSFANTIWPRFSSYVKSSSGLAKEELPRRSEVREIQEAVQTVSAGLPILKVKIYSLEGLTVYSSEATEIGEDKSNNPGFIAAARDGRPASKLTYRDTFSSFEGTVQNRDLVESYVPVRRDAGPVEGVFELYTDVTTLLVRIRRMTTNLVVGFVLVFGLAYGTLLLTARRAQRIINRQHADIGEKKVALEREAAERKQAEEALRQSEEQYRNLSQQLERRVAERTVELRAANEELEAFANSIAHDVRAPLRAMDGFAQALLEEYADKLGAEGRSYAERVRAGSQRMALLLDDLLTLAQITRGELDRREVDLSELARKTASDLQRTAPQREVAFDIAPGVVANGDERLLEVVIANLLDNAWKFTSKHRRAKIEFGVTEHEGKPAYYVRDDGAGFDMDYAEKLFQPFQRLHGRDEFPGTGIGLATVRRIVERHGGEAWITAGVEQGATVGFTLSTPREA